MVRGQGCGCLWRVKRLGHCLGFYLTGDQILFFFFGGRQFVSKIACFDGDKDKVVAPSARTFSYQERINNHKMFACLRTSYIKCKVLSEIVSWDREGRQW